MCVVSVGEFENLMIKMDFSILLSISLENQMPMNENQISWMI